MSIQGEEEEEEEETHDDGTNNKWEKDLENKQQMHAPYLYSWSGTKHSHRNSKCGRSSIYTAGVGEDSSSSS